MHDSADFFASQGGLRHAFNEIMEMTVTTLNLFSKNISHGNANDTVEGLEMKVHGIFTVLDI